MGKPSIGLRRGYLAKKGAHFRAVSCLDLAVMLTHIFKAVEDKEIGWADADHTLDYVFSKLGKTYFIDPRILESAVACANFLDEKGLFKHPQGYSFDAWMKRFTKPGGRFNRMYNLFEPHNREEKKNEPSSVAATGQPQNYHGPARYERRGGGRQLLKKRPKRQSA